jgi:hypothetical protein
MTRAIASALGGRRGRPREIGMATIEHLEWNQVPPGRAFIGTWRGYTESTKPGWAPTGRIEAADGTVYTFSVTRALRKLLNLTPGMSVTLTYLGLVQGKENRYHDFDIEWPADDVDMSW